MLTDVLHSLLPAAPRSLDFRGKTSPSQKTPAPRKSVSLEAFWQRIAAQWPEMLEAAHAKNAPAHLADLLELNQGAQSPSSVSLLSLDLEAFTALAAHVDVAKDNAEDLFKSIARSASGAHSFDAAEGQIYLEDFAEQMILWTEGVDRSRPSPSSHFAPAHAVVSALKAELLPQLEPHSPPKPPKPTKLPKLPKRRLHLPWCSYYQLRPNPVPSALT
eukprot:Skav221229  [mRNA]  locus=scaffold1136:36259:36909:+ [translate_table: standard]